MPRTAILGFIACTLASLSACGPRSAPPRAGPQPAMAALEVEADDVYVRVSTLARDCVPSSACQGITSWSTTRVTGTANTASMLSGS
jgi:hypothetical protein